MEEIHSISVPPESESPYQTSQKANKKRDFIRHYQAAKEGQTGPDFESDLKKENPAVFSRLERFERFLAPPENMKPTEKSAQASDQSHKTFTDKEVFDKIIKLEKETIDKTISCLGARIPLAGQETQKGFLLLKEHLKNLREYQSWKFVRQFKGEAIKIGRTMAEQWHDGTFNQITRDIIKNNLGISFDDNDDNQAEPSKT